MWLFCIAEQEFISAQLCGSVALQITKRETEAQQN